MQDVHDLKLAKTVGQLADELARLLAAGAVTRDTPVVTVGCDCDGSLGELHAVDGALRLARLAFPSCEECNLPLVPNHVCWQF